MLYNNLHGCLMVFYCWTFPELFHYFTEYTYKTCILHFYFIPHFAIISLTGNYEKHNDLHITHNDLQGIPVFNDQKSQINIKHVVLFLRVSLNSKSEPLHNSTALSIIIFKQSHRRTLNCTPG